MVFLPSISYCDDIKSSTTTTESVVCFKESDAAKIVVELENARDYQEQIELLKQANQELEKQITLLKEANKLQQEQLGVAKQTVESYKKLLETQKQAYEKKIENEKPSIWGKIMIGIGSLGVGVLVGLLL